jgi:ATP-dependent Lon protease
MFITTANTVHSIPRPLLDRMELIQISGYTEDEKVKIAERYLLPKQLKNQGLKPQQLQIPEATLLRVVREYTRESGVRNLEREVASLCRKTATKIVKENIEELSISPERLPEILGAPRYRFGVAKNNPEIGTVTGLAWTEVGGDVLSIEVTVFPGTGKLTLTGQLGDVMKESAQAGFSYIRSAAKRLRISETFYKDQDVHIHIPEGAIPKDGPSAGITMATALASALSLRAVRGDVAMTGEITLRGKVLPVGGLKEKTLAARRAGITTIILSADNKKDIEEIPADAKRDLKFIFVEHMDEVLPNALVPMASDKLQPDYSQMPVDMSDLQGLHPTVDL